MGIFTSTWACPFQVGVQLQVLAKLWAFHFPPHAFFIIHSLFFNGFQPQKNSQKGSQIGLSSVQQGYNKLPPVALAFTSLFSPLLLLSFFSFFLLGLCVCGGWGWLGVLVFCFLFFCFLHGWFFCFFVLFPSLGFRPARVGFLVWFLRFAFRCSSPSRLGRGLRFASCFLLCFVRLCRWSVRSCAVCVSFRFRLSRVFVRLWSVRVRSSLCRSRSFGGFLSSPSLGLFSCSFLPCRLASFLLRVALLLGARFGFVGFGCFCCWAGRSFACLASCWGASSCWLGLCFFGRWLLSSPLIL
jgi:hypothetical protein